MAETRCQALLKGAGSKELDGVIANRFDAIEREMRDMNEKRKEESRQIMLTLEKLMNQTQHPSTSQTFEMGENHRRSKNHTEPNRSNHQYHQSNHSGMTKMTKIDFPKFDGSKFKEWLEKAEQFFVIDMTPEEKKVGIASIHFVDEAATWHLALVQEDIDAVVLSSWREYKIRLKNVLRRFWMI